MDKRIIDSPAFRLIVFAACVAAAAGFGALRSWAVCVLAAAASVAAAIWALRLYRRNIKKITYMFDAVENSDYAFQFATERRSSADALVNKSMNRLVRILLKAKEDAAEREKYYEFIINSVNTGIIVLNEKGFVLQHNSEALRLLGLSTFTNVKQLGRIDRRLAEIFAGLQAGEKRRLSLNNERGAVNLSIRASETMLQGEKALIVVVNDIKSELEDKEIDSWMRLIRVLTHEIMNSVTPVASISDALLLRENASKDEIRNGLEAISETSKGLVRFVDSYRRFTHLPAPEPTLFYVKKFIARMAQLARHHNGYPNVAIETDVRPDDLILHADENLVGLAILNLLKNAMQAIGSERADGLIRIKAFCNSDEAVVIEVSDNGPGIPPDEAEHIFVPFFTTKNDGSGIGLSVARQIMRLHGGSIALKNAKGAQLTTFVLIFN